MVTDADDCNPTVLAIGRTTANQRESVRGVAAFLLGVGADPLTRRVCFCRSASLALTAPTKARRFDTHKYAHVAVAIDELGVRLSEHHASANRDGYARLEAWAASIGRVAAWGVEGTGSYGVAWLATCAATGTG